MRKYMTSVALLSFLLFALGAMAQTSGGYGQSGQANPPASSSESQDTSTTTTTTSSSQTTTGSQQQASSLEGCVVKEQADYFLVPRQGNPIKLQSSAGKDFSSHVGQRVTVSGNESSLSASAGAGTGATGGMAGTTAGTSGTTDQTGTGSAGAAGAPSISAGAQAGTGQTGTGATGTIGAPSTGAGAGTSGGMATSSDLHSLADRQLEVNNVSMIGSCPSNWNPSIPTTGGGQTR